MTRAALYLTPAIPDDAPSVVREGLARRRRVVFDGACRCGAVLRLPNRAERRRVARARSRVQTTTVQHEADCPAIAPELVAWAVNRPCT